MKKEKTIIMQQERKPTSPPGSSKDIQKAYENLCIAIIIQAVEEAREKRDKGDHVGECAIYRWLRVPWARLLMGDVDPEYIIRRIRDEEKQNNETAAAPRGCMAVVDPVPGPGRN